MIIQKTIDALHSTCSVVYFGQFQHITIDLVKDTEKVLEERAIDLLQNEITRECRDAIGSLVYKWQCLEEVADRFLIDKEFAIAMRALMRFLYDKTADKVKVLLNVEDTNGSSVPR
jgi:hypothetical protein